MNPSYRWGFDRMIPRYAYHKPFMVMFPDKCKWQKRFNLNSKEGPVWYTDGSKTNKGIGAVAYRCGSKRGHSFNLVLHTAVFQADIYGIKAFVIQNTVKDNMGRNIYIVTAKQSLKTLTFSR
jgi:hypothetical protein